MTFRSLALSNIRGNWRSYSAFFLSSLFSVMIFYIYAAFLYHPSVVTGHIMAAEKIRKGMVFCEYIIVIFSFLFVLYSNSAFLKTRQQEFGLFSLFGMTKTQLRKLVIYENAAIAIMAIVAGVGLGMLFSKLFFMALAVLLNLEEAIPFAAPLKAIGLTAGGFFVLFMIISIWTAFRIGRTEIVDLLKASRKPKGELVYSPWLVALSIVCLCAAYGMALIMNYETFFILALPILITVIIGTYFLFSQLSIVLLRFIQRRPSIYYKRTNMIVFAQLGYKMKDNARILFIVSILSAVIMTALGAVYISQIGGKNRLLDSNPYSMAYIEKGVNSNQVIDPEKLKAIVEQDGFKIVKEAKAVGVLINDFSLKWTGSEHNQTNTSAFIISATTYNKLALLRDQPTVQPENGKLTLIETYTDNNRDYTGEIKGTINGNEAAFDISGMTEAHIMNWFNISYFTLVIDDFSYLSLVSTVPESEQYVVHGYELSNWEKTADTVQKIKNLVPEELLQMQISFHRAEQLNEMNSSLALTLFIGMFISLLFFIASGSMIYFKLFTELQDDQAQFKALSRIGMKKSEIRKIVITQVGIIFYFPVIVGISHALFAMKALDNLLLSSNWIYSFYVIGFYIVLQTLYFLAACSSYMKSMLRGANVS